MNSESVDLIATDPPFNKGRDFHATPDSLAAGAKFQDRWTWERDVHEDWVDEITDDHPGLMRAINGARETHSDGMAAYLCFMAVRLLAMRRLLKPSGSIYLHCDHTASPYLRMLMDAIFGAKQFRNEIVWGYSGWNKRLRSHIERRHDVILFYARAPRQTFNYPTRPWTDKEEYVRTRKQKVRTDENGREYVLSDAGGGKRVRRYLDEAMSYGVPLDDVWPIPKLNNSDKVERTGFPTQKPLELYERIIKASSDEGGVVLDPFAGCATTLVAAERLNRQWVGIDIWKEAHQLVISRLEQDALLGRFKLGDIPLIADPPERTDEGDTAAPFLRVKVRVAEPDGPRWTRREMYEHLLEQHGPRCQGCDRLFDDPRYLELDHNTPRSDGGINHVSNRILLCGPCNRLKSNTYTLSGLRRENQKRGYMRGEES
ncbi:MAG: DNA methyltransferase [Acidobacteria bacterium]|nr:DNA methyltransferase [Acidobacteriota bacterium]